MGSHKMLLGNHKGLLQGKNGVKYKLEIDERGGMWITPDYSHAEIKATNQEWEEEKAKEIHERHGHISDRKSVV